MIKLDGKALSKRILADIQRRVSEFKENYQRTPRLMIVSANDDPASKVYIKSKTRACDEVGMYYTVGYADDETTLEEIRNGIEEAACRNDVDGIILQLPLAERFRGHERELINMIPPEKDVDGLTDVNLGKLLAGDESGFTPCTPKGIMRLLDAYSISLTGRDVAIVGRSALVGLPLFHLMTREGASVKVCHRQTCPTSLADAVNYADVVVSAAGSPALITPAYTSCGQVLIDVGINRTEEGLCGDISPDCYADSYAYTPVPGGIGPMTVAMLMENTLLAAERRAEYGY